MEKIVAFDESQSLDELMALPDANIDRTATENRVVTLRSHLEKMAQIQTLKCGYGALGGRSHLL